MPSYATVGLRLRRWKKWFVCSQNLTISVCQSSSDAESGVSIQVEMMFSSTFYVKCLSVCAVEVKKMLNIIHAFYAGGH